MEGSRCPGVVEVLRIGVVVNVNQNWRQVPHGQCCLAAKAWVLAQSHKSINQRSHCMCIIPTSQKACSL